MSEEIENIKKRVVRHPDSVDLYIKRLPKKTREFFVEFANTEFVGDYGMALKFIVDEFLVNGPRLEMILSILDNYEARLTELEGNKPKSSEKIKGIRNHLKKRKEMEEKKNE